MFLKPPVGFFVPYDYNVFDMPINCVGGPPLFYKGDIAGNPLNFVDDYGHPRALNLVKTVTEINIFHDMSIYQTKGQDQGNQGKNHSPNYSYGLARKALNLPNKPFLVRSLCPQIFKSENCEG